MKRKYKLMENNINQSNCFHIVCFSFLSPFFAEMRNMSKQKLVKLKGLFIWKQWKKIPTLEIRPGQKQVLFMC